VYDCDDVWVETKPKVVIDFIHKVFNTRVIDDLVEREGDERYYYEEDCGEYPPKLDSGIKRECDEEVSDSEGIINLGKEGESDDIYTEEDEEDADDGL